MKLPLIVLSLTVLLVSNAAAMAQPISASQWSEDIEAVVAAIREYHPDPFWSDNEEQFEAKKKQLIAELPALSEKDRVLRLASLVSLIQDGHTRLSIPRTHYEFAFDPSHTGSDAPAHPELMFETLPVRFFLFEDGLHIVETTAKYRQYLGAKVMNFGSTSAEDAISAVRPILDAENEMGERLLAADRLSLPAVLRHFEIIETQNTVPLTILKNEIVQPVQITPVEKGNSIQTVEPTFDEVPLYLRNPDNRKWHQPITGSNAWYIQIDEIEMFPELLLSDFMADALRQARSAGAERILLDLRQNHGGTASFNPSIISALAQSEYNAFGRLYVLTGRETFSAASMLMGAFEQYTNAIFVGEPSSARPSSFGDPKKIQLPNSGLTLRVSTLAWRSWLAGEFRTFRDVHIDAEPTAGSFFAGHDDAVEAALSYSPPEGPVSQMAELFEMDKLQSGLLRFFSWLNTPIEGSHDAVDELVAHGHSYLDKGELKKGRFMMTMARDYYPTDAAARVGLGRAIELNGDEESALKRYREALELDPGNEIAQQGLARLSKSK